MPQRQPSPPELVHTCVAHASDRHGAWAQLWWRRAVGEVWLWKGRLWKGCGCGRGGRFVPLARRRRRRPPLPSPRRTLSADRRSREIVGERSREIVGERSRELGERDRGRSGERSREIVEEHAGAQREMATCTLGPPRSRTAPAMPLTPGVSRWLFAELTRQSICGASSGSVRRSSSLPAMSWQWSWQ